MDQLNLFLGIASSVLGILVGVVGLWQMRRATASSGQPRSPRRKRALAIAAVTMIVLMVLGGWFLARGRRPSHLARLPAGQSQARATSPISLDVRWLVRPESQSVPTVITDGMVIKSGAYYALYLLPEKATTVYVFQIDSTFHVDQLFPSADIATVNPLKSAKEQYLPSANQWYKLDDVPGQEMLVVLASEGPTDAWQNLGYSLKAAIEKDLRSQSFASPAAPGARGNDGIEDLPAAGVAAGGEAIFARVREVLDSAGAPFVREIIFWHE